ncbi:Copalyl diphosphate synthase [Xylogone sp. PMI_703]|nr:Copalyl diphosphate synthase [Xylogone sp. PMI_703]
MQLLNYFADDARSLLRRTLANYDEQYGLGAMSCAAYDTAWVSLVTKSIDGKKQWLFPECFQYLLATQSDEGGWAVGTGAQIDGLLNTAAPLLALKRYASEPLQLQLDAQDLTNRIERATVSLRSQLAAWDVSTTDHVGFEIIVPAMLEYLQRENPSLVFEFDGKTTLLKINNAKMSRFRAEYLYGPRRMTALHSLESFIGKIDFDKVKHHKVQGSMMGSPSSTAAYLMHASQWDDESEAYLRHVIKFAAGQNSGGVPSAFPSTHFEITWILSTLLRGGFAPSDLESAELSKLTEIMDNSFEKENGVLGFAPYFQSDVDDMAKTITSLNILGLSVSPESMIQAFEAETHFRTYADERDPSCTANSNALAALLHQPDVSLYSSQIFKLAKFLSDCWWNSDGKIKDKWNVCYLYPSVLLVETLVDLLFAIEQNKRPGVFDQEIQFRIAITLFQACLRPLLEQQANGSWNQSLEETAYAVLILAEARRLAFFDGLHGPLNDAIARGVAFINSFTERPLNYIWIEKVSYASPLLTDAYILAALKAASSPPGATVGGSLWHDGVSAHMDKHVQLFHKAPLFSSLPYWELQCSMVEAALFIPLLKARQEDVFPRKDVKAETKYFDVLAFFWTSSNNRERTYASTTFIYDMSVISLLIFQIDEFMEDEAGSLFLGRFDELRQIIGNLFGEDYTQKNGSANGHTNGHANGHANGSVNGSKGPHGANLTNEEVSRLLSKFINYIEGHPSVQNASAWDKQNLHRELRTFLLAHTQQVEDSSRFMQRADGKVQRPRSSDTFFHWVRTTSADHIAAPYSYAFISCLLSATLTPGGGGGDCFPTGKQKYLSAAVCRHMATMCRMYNDLGSVDRDNAEGNLNSVDFPEFDDIESLDGKKIVLYEIADFERSCFNNAFARLAKAAKDDASKMKDREAIRLAERRMAIFTMFSEEVDLYGQVYATADLSRLLPGSQDV